MDSYIIQIQPRDEITVIIDKIINTQADRVYLLVPDNSRIAQSALNFRLIKRESEALGKEVIVVSSNAQVQSLALKSALQVHIETSEFKQGAEHYESYADRPARLSDVFIASPPVKKQIVIPKNKIKEEEPAIDKSVDKSIDIPTKAKEITKTAMPEGESAIARFWKEPILRSKVPLLSAPKNIFVPLLKHASKLSLHNFPLKNFRATMFLFVGVAAIVAAVTFYSILPRAKVQVTPLIEEVMLEMLIKGNINVAQVQPDKFIIPAQMFEKSLESAKTIMSTGERKIQEKSSGTIKVYNKYSSSPQTLVKTTRFLSQDGKIFRTLEQIIVPGAEVDDGKIVPSYTTAEIIAADAGEEYNIGPSTFSIPGFHGTAKYLAFYGESEQNFTGGKIGTAKIISQDDYSKSSSDLTTELKARAEQELAAFLPEGFVTPEGAKSISDVEIISENKVGDALDEFTMRGIISIKSFAIPEKEILDMLERDFSQRFTDKKLLALDDTIQYSVIKTDFSKGVLDVKAVVTKKAYLTIDLKEIMLAVAGKDEKQVRVYLSGLKNIKAAKITFWPFWVSEMPADLNKIEVIIEGITAP